MNDTEQIDQLRLQRRAVIAGAIESTDPDAERTRLQAEHGQVWDSEQLFQEFSVEGFMAPFVVVRRKADNVQGSMEFQHYPRFYFNFIPV